MKNLTWIDPETLPPSATCKIVNKTDPDYGMTQDEIADRNEYIRCYLLKEFEPLMAIPLRHCESDFFIEEWKDSAFNTMDFYRQHRHRQFRMYAHRIRKTMEAVQHLAILHSCVNAPEGRQRIQQWYNNLIDTEFRNKAEMLIHRYRQQPESDNKHRTIKKIAELNSRITECKKVWERYAPP